MQTVSRKHFATLLLLPVAGAGAGTVPSLALEEFMVPAVDPGRLTGAHAEWDADLPSYMLYAYFAKLVNVPYKRYVEIGEGTHTIVMEKNRMQLFPAVQQFLDERIQPDE